MAEEVKEKKPNVVAACCSGFGRFLYNPDDHTVMGRGGGSWAKISLFYLVFYSCLAAFFGICLHVMLMTLPEDRPTVIARTNKPYLAASEPGLYNMNFKDEDAWKVYKKAATDLKKKYEEPQQDPNATDKYREAFKFEAATVGFCADDTKIVKSSGVGCFFVGLNRIIAYVPQKGGVDLTSDEHLAFNCSFDIGKSGKGNLSPPVTFEMFPKVEDQAYEGYYPWLSKKLNGLQPIAAIKIVLDAEAAKEVKDENLETFLKCNAVIRNVNGTMTILDDARPADFEIEYSNE